MCWEEISLKNINQIAQLRQNDKYRNIWLGLQGNKIEIACI
jgi:hypothetical protein